MEYQPQKQPKLVHTLQEMTSITMKITKKVQTKEYRQRLKPIQEEKIENWRLAHNVRTMNIKNAKDKLRLEGS